MSESDIDTAQRTRKPSTNDVFSPNFRSMLDPAFTRKVGARQVGFRNYVVEGEQHEAATANK